MGVTAALATPDVRDPYEDFIALTLETFAVLKAEGDLSPENPRVNKCLAAFVSAVLDISKSRSAQFAKTVLQHQSLQEIRARMLQRLSCAEYEMERYFAQIFAAKGPMTLGDLDEFWYRGNYSELVAEEIRGMRASGLEPSGQKIVFVGSGPLPLSAIDMHLQTGAEIVCVDNDAEAVTLSRQMIENLGLSDRITVHHASGETFDYQGSGLVFVASLIGKKADVIAQIRTTEPGADVAVRSVEGLKAVLYEPIDPQEMVAHGLECIGSSADAPGIINTAVFFSPREMSAGSCLDCSRACPSRTFNNP